MSSFKYFADPRSGAVQRILRWVMIPRCKSSYRLCWRRRIIWISQSSLSLSFSLHWMHFASLKFFEPLILNSASARQILCTFHFLWEYCPLEIWKLLTSAVSPSDQVREATSRRKEYCEECKSFILLNRQRLMVRALKEESARPWSGEQVWGFYELVSLFLNLTSPPAITKK